MVADFDVFQVVDPHFFSNPVVVADLQPPGVFDVLPRLEHIALPYSGSKGAEERRPQAAERQAAAKKQAVHRVPAQLLYGSGTGRIMG
ncbi:MAG: hypothetical protein ACK55I_09660, partial [bacterium]